MKFRGFSKFRERLKKREIMGSRRRQQKIEKYFEKINPIKTKKKTREGEMKEAREDKRMRMRNEGDDKTEIGDLGDLGEAAS